MKLVILAYLVGWETIRKLDDSVPCSRAKRPSPDHILQYLSQVQQYLVGANQSSFPMFELAFASFEHSLFHVSMLTVNRTTDGLFAPLVRVLASCFIKSSFTWTFATPISLS
jgi:hypothetical protein